ncbi:MAG: 3-oxoacyl-[acyl-carrier-protein] reductase [Spirochaetes bacterium]|nr:3-oxoacyl-[acyl-carrier-protein] reductase [Spirochaetota bacterium]
MLLKDKIAVISGANSGIGKATTLLFLKEGAKVCAIARNIEKLNKLKEEANSQNLFTFVCDVSKKDDILKTSNEILKLFPEIDILINNAGITKDTLLLRMSEEQWDSVLDTNLKGAFLLTQAFLQSLMKKKNGVILNTTSVVGIYGNAGQANYVSSKAGLIGFTKTVAKEYGKRGIRCNAVAPGYITTDMTENLPQDIKNKIIENIPLQRLGTPEDVANLFLFLASDLASYITGQVIEVSGGLVF